MTIRGGEVAVFVETNVRTYMVLAVSPDISAADFKRKLEAAHFNCFPKSGEIRVQNLMVNRKSCFYHLPDSFPIKYSFQGLKRTWFLHAEVSTGTSNVLDKSVRNDITWKKMEGFKSTKGLGTVPATASDADNTKKMTKIVKNFSWISLSNGVKGCPSNKGTSDDVLEGTHTVNKNCTPVNSGTESTCCSSQWFDCNSTGKGNEPEKQLKAKHSTDYSVTQTYPLPQFAVRMPARICRRSTTTDCRLKGSVDQLEKTAAVGKRILTAAAKLRISRSNPRACISLYRVRGSHGSSMIRPSIFEISDDED
ncbi:hypothetical protein K2173_000941 [Erythroxylum novogranatense]|uniref:Uncharacterized protein n=1 Tax=Erythroxylum novogranatense TaxID=1862640 RepID=A0AAV8TQE3_9ROSI|nr:hypothetical protein K2173_000941 [Erythroxylum novogranatense]